MKTTARQWLLSAGLSCLMAILVGAGFVAGRYSVIRTFDSWIEGFARSVTLGPLLTKKERKAVCRAYHDGSAMLGKLDDISWSVPNVLAPFLGSVPEPGVHRGARINSMHFRADKEITLPKPANTFRIFLTGGSTAFGTGAPDQNRTIAGYLAELLARDLTPITKVHYEVFTLANPAWVSTHERIAIENRLSEMAPDLVISFSGNNDVHWGILRQNVLWFRTYADALFDDLIKKIYTLTGRHLPEVILPQSEKIPPSLVAARLLKNVKLSSYTLSLEQVPYIFVLQPTLTVTRKPLTKRERKYLTFARYFQECYDQIDRALQGFHLENFTYLNFSGIFDQLSNKDDIFLDSYHFGDKGNEIISENIYNNISRMVVR